MSRLSTAQSKPVRPLAALRNYWLKAFTFKGRATRAEYNWALLAWVIGVYAIGGLEALTPGVRDSVTADVAFTALVLALTVPWFALIARRCHDMGKSGRFGLVLLVPTVGLFIVAAALAFGESAPEEVLGAPPSL